MMKIITAFFRFVAAVGALNWGLVAFLQFNLVEYVTKMVGVENLDKGIYAIVALAGLYTILTLFKS